MDKESLIRKWKENEDMFNVQMKLLENMKNEQKMIMNKLLTGNEGTAVRSVCDVSGAVKETNGCWATASEEDEKRAAVAVERDSSTTNKNIVTRVGATTNTREMSLPLSTPSASPPVLLNHNLDHHQQQQQQLLLLKQQQQQQQPQIQQQQQLYGPIVGNSNPLPFSYNLPSISTSPFTNHPQIQSVEDSSAIFGPYFNEEVEYYSRRLMEEQVENNLQQILQI